MQRNSLLNSDQFSRGAGEQSHTLLAALGKQLKKTHWQGLTGAREDRCASVKGAWVPPACSNVVGLIQLLHLSWPSGWGAGLAI